MIRLVLLLSLAVCFSNVNAQVIEVFVWDPIASVPNAQQQLFSNAAKAKAIQEKHGAVVRARRNMLGQLHFSLTHDSYAAMNKFYTSLNADPANAAFWEVANANPVAKQIGFGIVDVVAAGKSGPISDAFIWQPMPGRLNDTVQNAMGAKAIHEKAGVGITIGIDRTNRMIYIVNYENFEQYSKFWDTPNEEFNEYMAGLNEDPAATLVDSVHLIPTGN